MQWCASLEEGAEVGYGRDGGGRGVYERNLATIPVQIQRTLQLVLRPCFVPAPSNLVMRLLKEAGSQGSNT